MASLVIALFFLRFWRSTRDRFFMYSRSPSLSKALHRVYSALTTRRRGLAPALPDPPAGLRPDPVGDPGKEPAARKKPRPPVACARAAQPSDIIGSCEHSDMEKPWQRSNPRPRPAAARTARRRKRTPTNTIVPKTCCRRAKKARRTAASKWPRKSTFDIRATMRAGSASCRAACRIDAGHGGDRAGRREQGHALIRSQPDAGAAAIRLAAAPVFTRFRPS
jgi:hypothetical protein